ncbi:Protein of unknown function [Lactobacillus helveticus CIRM-BIA 104]|uniref:Uncharacterized protein n=1 Tax=Lactobacillus helveticus CIRM-BIA 104 TaxID=1226333 RepID=U6F833_LACHE|nr:Protein of unknown function [Lactobacillus helveticus CIRM-BIA 104]
MDKLWIDYSI